MSPAMMQEGAEADIQGMEIEERQPPLSLTRGGRDLNEDELEKLGETLVNLIKRGREGRQQRDFRVQEWRRRWDMVRRPRRTGPWKGSSNYVSPLTRYTGETIAAHIKHVVTGIEPYIRVRSMDVSEDNDALQMQRYIHAQLTEDVDFIQKMDEAVDMGVRDGFCCLVPHWRYEVGKEKDWEILDEDLMAELGVDYNEDGTVTINGKRRYIGQEVEVDREMVVKDCIGVDVVDYMDFVVYPSTSRTVASASLVGDRLKLTLDELRHMARAGEIDEDQLKKLEELKPAVTNIGNDEQTGEYEYDMREGLSDEGQESFEEHGKLEVYRCIYSWDCDDDGLKEDCFFLVEMSRRVVLAGKTWPFWKRERNYIPFVPFHRPKRLYGYAIGEILNDLQIQDNVLTNQSVDVGTLNLTPIVKELRNARTKFGSRQLELGKIQLVDAMDEFQIEHFNLPQQGVIADRNRVMDTAERLSGASETIQGVPTRGANTLGEVRESLRGGAVRLDSIISRCQSAVTELGRWIIALDRQNITSASVDYSVTLNAVEIFGSITKEQIRRRLRVRAHGNTLNTDRTLELQGAEKIFQAKERSPFMVGNIVHQWRAEHYFFSKFLDEPEWFIGSEEEAAAMQERLENTESEEQEEPWPNITGRLDETASLAVLLNERPELEEAIGKVLRMRRDAEIATAGGQVLVDNLRRIGQLSGNQGSDANGRGGRGTSSGGGKAKTGGAKRTSR